MLENRWARLLRDPLRPIRRRMDYFRQRARYETPEGYDSAQYWRDRLSRYGFSKRGVGIAASSDEENEQAYTEASRTLLNYCVSKQISWAGKRVLDIGCGTGFYAQIAKDQRCKSYTGVDITDELFAELTTRFEGFNFVQLDISETPPPSSYDLIVMIDVTQHIVEEARFKRAMGHVRSHLHDQGVFLVTSWLVPAREQEYFYHVKRPRSAYENCFPDCVLLDAVPFRDKYLFAIRPVTTPPKS